jgi:hypothetical protein
VWQVDIWMDREIKSWNMVLSKNEVDLTDFVKEDLARITDRAESQVSSAQSPYCRPADRRWCCCVSLRKRRT